MKPILIIAVLVLATVSFSSCAASGKKATSPSSSSATSTASPSENVEQALTQMEREWGDAFVKRDTASLERIMANDWAGISWDGKTYTKAQTIAEVKSGTTTVESTTMEPLKVRVFGDTAVVTGGDTEKSKYQGKDTSGRYLWTDVFVKRNGRWQAVASHSTRVEPAKP
jgi:ketosteroid isomerase-like protein